MYILQRKNYIIKAMIKKLLKLLKTKSVKRLLATCAIIGFILAGLFALWLTTVELPDINNFENRLVAQSTKIYDKTGKVVLFDVHGNVRRTVVSLDKISDHVEKATISIEDENFYNHHGIEPTAILRAIFNNVKEGNLLHGQGGSTITQQVIKNSLLTTDKKISRKIKEWILAPRLEAKLTKDQILEVYLNEVPYGGTVYGIQEASRRFFGKDAIDLNIIESAYLAALPQAPTYYSPYGNNLEDLEKRKNKVLQKMLENNYITQEEYNKAKSSVVKFEKQEDYGIKAPHFVMFIKEQLEKKYGAEAIESGGLKVITTLDYDLQKEGEEIAKRYALENKIKFNAENTSITAVDPTNGQILTMVGSRDYFDSEIDGNYNISTTERQPGSSFKPFVYAAAFDKGYRPDTVLFDLPTEFSSTCSSGGNCYNPGNYDDKFVGPINLRNALAQSRNIPAVKVLYLAGIKNSIELARSMGISTLGGADQYGLTLVLGGAEVKPLDMAGAYSVFAKDGIKNEITGILRVEDNKGNVLEEYQQKETRVLSEQTSRLINDVLSDNVARTPLFGANSLLNFGNTDVAAKTGTTNDYRDAWIVGYTPAITVVAWAGNNDNSSMEKKTSGLIVSPMWSEFIKKAISKYPAGNFIDPTPLASDVKPVLKGDWQSGGVHSILYFVDKDNPNGPQPNNPSSDSQFDLWENPISLWSQNQNIDDVLNLVNKSKPEIKIVSPGNNEEYIKSLEIFVAVAISQGEIKSGKVYLNNEFLGDLDPEGGVYSFIPSQTPSAKKENKLKVEVIDSNNNTITTESEFTLID
jgi:1A family penicillin-binding protein